MRNAYCLAINFSSNVSSAGSWIWKLATLPRIQIFIWKCMKQSIGVRECLANRGIPLETTCPLCHIEVESILHALRDCNLVRPIWYQLGSQCLYSNFFSQDIRDWLTSNCRIKSNQNSVGIPWNVLFSFIIWLVWKQRNQCVFTSRGHNPNLGKTIALLASEFFLCAAQPRSHKRMVTKRIRWEKPDQGWLKLNTDGSWNAPLGSAAGGGVIRDSLGNWVVGFARKLGSANSFTAEVWALRDGLMLCLQRNFSAIIVEIDAKALVDALNSPSHRNSVISPIF